MGGTGRETRFDALRLAKQAGTLSGTIDARALPQVADGLAPGPGAVPIVWTVAGAASVDGRPALSVSVSGRMPLVCQRCLAPFDWVVDQSTELVLAADERELAALDERIEAEVIAADRPIDAAELVEAELVLSLPYAPRHEGACPS